MAPIFFAMSVTAQPEAMMLGGSMGISYFVAYFFVIYAIRHVGASSTTVVSVLSMIVPIGAGIFIWHEEPNTFQYIGIVLALVALTLIGGQAKPKPKKSGPLDSNPDQVAGPAESNSASKTSEENQQEGHLSEISKTTSPAVWLTPLILAIFFALCGFNRLTQESFKHLCEPVQFTTFLFFAFCASGVPSIVFLIFRRKPIRLTEALFGVGLGLANLLQTYFILKSLDYLKGFIVFPVTSAGAVGLTTLIATVLLGERLTLRTKIGITVAVIAMFLLKFWDSNLQ